MESSFHEEVIGITIHPVLSGLKGLDDRMAGAMKMLRGMLVF